MTHRHSDHFQSATDWPLISYSKLVLKFKSTDLDELRAAGFIREKGWTGRDQVVSSLRTTSASSSAS